MMIFYIILTICANLLHTSPTCESSDKHFFEIRAEKALANYVYLTKDLFSFRLIR